MCLCAYVFARVCKHVSCSTYAYMLVCTHVSVYMSCSTYAYMLVCTHVSVYMFIYFCVQVYVYHVCEIQCVLVFMTCTLL